MRSRGFDYQSGSVIEEGYSNSGFYHGDPDRDSGLTSLKWRQFCSEYRMARFHDRNEQKL